MTFYSISTNPCLSEKSNRKRKSLAKLHRKTIVSTMTFLYGECILFQISRNAKI